VTPVASNIANPNRKPFMAASSGRENAMELNSNDKRFSTLAQPELIDMMWIGPHQGFSAQ
jgi:hypothetical protein